MPRGRPPKPTHLRIIEGNPGKRRLPATEPKQPPAKPRAPDEIGPRAAKVWRFLIPKLDELGIISPIDRYTLRTLCEAVARYEEATEMIIATGLLVAGRRKGEAVRNPLLIAQRQAAQEIATFSGMFRSQSLRSCPARWYRGTNTTAQPRGGSWTMSITPYAETVATCRRVAIRYRAAADQLETVEGDPSDRRRVAGRSGPHDEEADRGPGWRRNDAN